MIEGISFIVVEGKMKKVARIQTLGTFISYGTVKYHKNA